LLPIYSNLLSPVEFGNYALLMSTYLIVSVFFQGGLQASFSKFYLEEENVEKKKIIFSTLATTIFLFAFILTIFFVIGSSYISSKILGSNNYSDLVLIVSLLLFIDSCTQFVLHLLKTEEKAKKVVSLTSINALINFVLNLLFVLFLKLGVKGILISQLISSFTLFLLIFPEIFNNFHFSYSFPIFKKSLIFSIPLIFSGVFTTLIDVGDRFILNLLLDKSTVGIYSFSYRIAMIMNVFVISFRTAWAPRFMNEYSSGEYQKSFGKNFTKLMFISTFIFLIISLFADDLFHFRFENFSLVNSNYLPGMVVIPFVLVGYIFNGFISFFSVYPYVSGKSYHFAIASALGLVVNISGNFLLIPHLWIYGAAWSTLFSFLTGAIYLYLISRKKIPIHYELKELLIIVSVTCIDFIISRSLNLFYVDIFLVLSYTLIILKVVKIDILNFLKLN
jgi:O-antigen/teichoic acid export membrane protein